MARIEHDRLFKELLSEFFADFIALFFPEVMQYLDPDSLVRLDKELFADGTAGDTYEADLVVQGKFRGEDTHFLLHVEHQATSRGGFDRRMFRYFSLLHEAHDLPVYPIALFSHDAPRRPESDTYRVNFPDLAVLEFRYRVVQLNRLQWEDFRERANPVASALMAKMKMQPSERPLVKLACLQALTSLGLNPAQIQLLSGFIDTYLQLNSEEEARFQTELERVAPAQQQEEVMQIVTSWMREGIEIGRREGFQEGLTEGRQAGLAEGRQAGLTEGLAEGRQAGLAEGLQEGQKQAAIAFVLRLLERKCGTIEEETRDRIEKLPFEQLEVLGEALLEFQGINDLERWLQALENAEAERDGESN